MLNQDYTLTFIKKIIIKILKLEFVIMQKYQNIK